MQGEDTIVNCTLACALGGECSVNWEQTFEVDGTSVRVDNGAVGRHNNVIVSCSAYPAVDVVP
jgi:hypothetical protein